jgi:SAM-dependent methyltransferase
VEVQPPLARRDVRAARTAEARRMRKGSVGLSRAGARLDEEARYSLTPEALALCLGRDAIAMGVRRVIDACCGAGGNAIGFARAGARVIAVDADAGRLAMARHNAALYGVADAIELHHGDARALVPDLEGDLLFVDPPWTRGYDRTRVTLDALPLLGALWEQRRRVQLWAKVPPSFDPDTAPGVTRVRAVFGAADGDRRRVKFLVLEASAG